jgi:hypothetical protein
MAIKLTKAARVMLPLPIASCLLLLPSSKNGFCKQWQMSLQFSDSLGDLPKTQNSNHVPRTCDPGRNAPDQSLAAGTPDVSHLITALNNPSPFFTHAKNVGG